MIIIPSVCFVNTLVSHDEFLDPSPDRVQDRPQPTASDPLLATQQPGPTAHAQTRSTLRRSRQRRTVDPHRINPVIDLVRRRHDIFDQLGLAFLPLLKAALDTLSRSGA